MKLFPMLVLCGAVLPGLAHARAADGRPVRNSFINRPVGETSDLLAHVKSSRVVADRYQRHFAMDRATLLQFLGGLHRGRLKDAGFYTIYSVPKGGRLKMHIGRIGRGEPMFFDRKGQPTLVAKCGNPIVLGPSRSQKGNPSATGPQDGAAARSVDLGTARMAEAATVMALEPSLPVNEVSAASTSSIVPIALASDVVPTSATEIETASGEWGATLLASLSFLAPFAAATPREGSPLRNITPVPEPLSLFAVAIGVAGMRQRNRRRS